MANLDSKTNELSNSTCAELIEIPDYDPDRRYDHSYFSYLRHSFQNESVCSVVTFDIMAFTSSTSSTSLDSSLPKESNTSSPLSSNPSKSSKQLETQLSQASFTFHDASFTSKSLSLYAEMKSKFELIKFYTEYHPSLCTYIDCCLGQLEYSTRIFLIQESFPATLASLLNSDSSLKNGCQILLRLQKWTSNLVSGLAHLQLYDIQHRNLTLQNIYVDQHDNLKIFNYAVYSLTSSYENLSWTSFYICPPECLYFGTQGFSSFKADTWALGLILYQVFTGTPPLPQSTPEAYFDALLELVNCPDQLLSQLNQTIPSSFSLFKSFLKLCLEINPESRPTAYSLLTHPFLHSTSIPISLGRTDQSKNLHVLFQLWQLDSGSLDTEFTKATGLTALPPILTFPFIASSSSSISENREQESNSSDLLSSTDSFQLRVHPLFILDFSRILSTISSPLTEPLLAYFSNMNRQPLQVRLKSVSYQFHRIQYCTHLLLQYPISKQLIQETCLIDIPSFLRLELWAALLFNPPPYTSTPTSFSSFPSSSVYSKFSILRLANSNAPDEKWISLERQLDADVPRCHVYEPLMSSELGQRRLKALIQTWLLAHPEHVYWQGFDSVCAVFLSCQFVRLELVYFTLTHFLDQYLVDLFVPNNTESLQSHLKQVPCVLTYLDPLLSSHLSDLHLEFSHFAISWILTLFAHTFEFSQIYLLWDQLIAYAPISSSFLLLCDVLRLASVRSNLMSTQKFEDGLHLLSELPLLDVFELIQLVQSDLQWIPSSTLASFHLTSQGEHQIPQISFQDCTQHLMHLRIIDLRSLSPKLPSHLPGTTFISLTHLSGIEPIMKEQRDFKKITVLRGDATSVHSALPILHAWGIPGVCWLSDLDAPACDCTPNEVSFVFFVIHKCKNSVY